MRVHLCMLVAISVSVVCEKNGQTKHGRPEPQTHLPGGKQEHSAKPVSHDRQDGSHTTKTHEHHQHPRLGNKKDVDKSHHDKAKHNSLQEKKHKTTGTVTNHNHNHTKHHNLQEDKHKPITKGPEHVRHQQTKHHKLLGEKHKSSKNAYHTQMTPTSMTTTAPNHNGTKPHKGGVGQMIVAPMKTCPEGTRRAPNGYCMTIYE